MPRVIVPTSYDPDPFAYLNTSWDGPYVDSPSWEGACPTRLTDPDDGTPAIPPSAEEKIIDIPTAAEYRAWRDRQFAKYDNGTYAGVLNFSGAPRFLHVASDPSQVAYFPSWDYAMRDRVIVCRLGRYLKKFYGGAYTDPQIADLVAAYDAERNATYQLTRDPDEIERIYQNGPSSCMSKDTCEYMTSIHPTRVYGQSPDLALAYVLRGSNPIARAIVWPDRHLYSRIYGHEGLLRALLEKDGYTPGGMDGARVRAVYDDGRIVMPYVDGIDTGTLQGSYVVLDDGGDVLCQRTDGLGVDADPEPEYTCERCDSPCDEDEQYCRSCMDDAYICSHCGQIFWEDPNYADLDSHDDDPYCDRCFSIHARACAACGRTWIEKREFSAAERAANGLHDYCPDCTDERTICPTCHEIVLTDEDHDCQTAPLPLEAPADPVGPFTFYRHSAHLNEPYSFAGAQHLLAAVFMSDRYVADLCTNGDVRTGSDRLWALGDPREYVRNGTWTAFTPVLAEGTRLALQALVDLATEGGSR